MRSWTAGGPSRDTITSSTLSVIDLRLRFQQQSGSEQSDAASRRAKHLRQPTPLLIQLWLAAGKDNPADTQVAGMSLDVVRGLQA